MTKNIFICTIIALIGMLIIGFYSAYITKETIEKRSFESRTKNEFFELSSLNKKDFEELLFLKSIFLYGNITQIAEQNFHVDKSFCTQINSEMQKLILRTIEKRVSMSEEERKVFNQKFQSLLNLCKQF